MRGGALRVGSYAAGTLLSAVGAALLLRHLGTIDVGRYVLAASVVAIVGGISDLGLTAVGVRDSATLPPVQRSSLFADLLGLRLTLTLLGMAVAVPLVWVAYSTTIALGVLLAGAGLALQTIQDNLALVLQVQLRLGAIAALELLRQALTVAGMVALVLAGGQVLAFLAISIPVGICVLAVLMMIVRGQRSLRPNFNWSRWRRLLIQVLPFSAAVAASILYFRVAILMVSLLSNAGQQGIFGSSYRVIDNLTLLPGVIAGAALPIFSHAASSDRDRFAYGIGKVAEVGLIVGAGTALALGIGSPFLMHVLGGAEFSSVAPVLTIQGIGLGATFFGAVWANGLLSMGLYREIMILNIAALLAMIAMLAVLVPLDGARGAAIATALGEIGNATSNGWLVIRRNPTVGRSLRVIPRVALAAGAGVATVAIPDLSSLERTLIAGALYLTVLALLRAYPRELADLMPGRRGQGLRASP